MLNATDDKTKLRAAAARRPVGPASLGRRIRVLVVDDSVVIRRVVTQVLGEDPDIEIAGIAANGVIALARIPQVNPDVVSLDIEMPEMDGLETLRRIRKQYPKLHVIMFSTLTARGAKHTLEALSLGANDYVTKPANVGSLNRSMDRLRTELVPKIKQFFEAPPAVRPAPRPVATPQAAAARRGAPYTPIMAFKPEVVAIGVSTGGPNALAQIFPQFPANFPCPILVVQHMPPLFTRMLAERLCQHSRLTVVEAAEGMAIKPGLALIAPGDYHMQVVRRQQGLIVRLDQGPPQNSCRPAVDALFSALAKVCGGRVLSVVLTGMGQDGLRGAQELKSQGAAVLAQDQASSVVWGMPGSVASAGLADKVLPLDAVVPEILRRMKLT
jgi:two-component system, chemotaxis family, protein-glutamate methylesterase/glutaminase